MEQFLLSPDVAVQSTAQNQSTNNSTTANEGESFNPILEEAVAGQQSLEDSQQGTADQTQAGLSEGKEENINTESANQAVAAEVMNTGIVNQNQQLATPTQTPLPTLPLAPTTQLVVPEPITQTNADPSLPLTESAAPTGTASKAETILLQQIQQIIDEGKNVGAITIKGSNTQAVSDKEQNENLQMLSSPVLNETDADVIQVRQLTGTQVLPGEQKTFTQNTSKPESGRQDITEQFLNAKIGKSQKGSEEQTANQQFGQKGNDGQNKTDILNPTVSTASTLTETAPPNETSFSQQLRSGEFSNTNSSTTSIEGKFAPGATQVVPERELVDNLIQRFNVNPRLQTSKLSLQLHPAELGQIKIDILVKGDSISANIVAQSQQVFETLDKHMTRLRGVLEDQGFNVDSFEVTLQTDSDKQQNLFQEHFDSQQQFATNSEKTTVQTEDSFDVQLDSEELDTEHSASGLNVTA
jgi:flagellar hook-length control protein FliK